MRSPSLSSKCQVTSCRCCCQRLRRVEEHGLLNCLCNLGPGKPGCIPRYAITKDTKEIQFSFLSWTSKRPSQRLKRFSEPPLTTDQGFLTRRGLMSHPAQMRILTIRCSVHGVRVGSSVKLQVLFSCTGPILSTYIGHQLIPSTRGQDPTMTAVCGTTCYISLDSNTAQDDCKTFFG